MKTREEIAHTLKELRMCSGLTSKEVIDQLQQQGVIVSTKTLYGWENAHSQPNADTLLLLCAIYGVQDILRAFGYSEHLIDFTITNRPQKIDLLKRVDKLNEETCKIVSAFIDGLLTSK
ncbi:MAG: helix-turn-helix protein [Oscillospiraceae bacterium]|nr:helix-turn-helix protein [Oscillospiraceae bacterium]